MRSMNFAVIVIVALMLFVSGCSDKGGQETADGSTEGGIMVVTVNGREVLEDQVAQEAGRLLSQLSGRVPPEQLESMRDMVRQQALDNMINRLLLEQEAEKAKIEITDEQVTVRVDQVKGGFSSEEAFTEQLATSGLTEAGLMQEVELAIRIEKLLEERTSGQNETEEQEAREFYIENMGRFKQAEQIKTSHILIPVEEADTEEMKAEKKQKLEGILEKVRGGADFAELAQEHSSCPSKARGGDLGFFPRGQMVGEFDEAAFALEVGQVSDVVETQFGYHIIKLTDKKAATTVPFDESKAEIMSFLDSQKKQQEVATFIDSLRSVATIQYPDTSSTQ